MRTSVVLAALLAFAVGVGANNTTQSDEDSVALREGLPCSCVLEAWYIQDSTSSWPSVTCQTEAYTNCTAYGNQEACSLVYSSLTWEELAEDLGEAADRCGVWWMSNETIMALAIDQRPIWEWSYILVANWLFFNSETVAMQPGVHEYFINQNISGATWMAMQPSDFVDLGMLTYGLAIDHTNLFNKYIEDVFTGPPTDGGDEPANVAVHVAVERLIEVSPPNFFEVEFFLSLSWLDTRISSDCAMVKADSYDPQDPCTVFWKPEFTYPSALLGDDEPQIVEDYGTSFYVGKDSQADVVGRYPNLARSFGHTTLRMRAKFLTVMDYTRYPYDNQTFTFRIQSGAVNMADRVRFYSTTSSAIQANNQHPVWRVDRITAADGIKQFLPEYAPETIRTVLSAANPDPAFLFFAALRLNEANEARSISPEEALSYSDFTLYVYRYCGYYLGNYIILESLLVLLGWITFFMSPESIDSRLGIALTLVLAINVFQIVLVENLPETGYLTDLSLFTICNTVLLALVAAETVIVCEAYKLVQAHEEIERATRKHSNNKRSIAACVKIQRWARHLQGKGLRASIKAVQSTSDAVVRRTAAASLAGDPESAELYNVVMAEAATTVDKRGRMTARHVRERLRCCGCSHGRRFRPWTALRVRVSRWLGEHSRFFAYETDRMCAFIIFPALFATYFCAIFLRPGSNIGCSNS